MVKNVTKYNVIHKDKPKKAVIDADPPLCHENTRNIKAKIVINEDPVHENSSPDDAYLSEEDNQEFFDTVNKEDIIDDHKAIAVMASSQSLLLPEDSESDGSEEY